MRPEEIQKLKSLIGTSPILSASERAEWLALLDVMNDKQLLELEKILASNKQPAVSSKESLAPSTNKPKAVTPPPVGIQMPKLSHIMNLPNLGAFSQTAANRQSDFAKAMSDKQAIVKPLQDQQSPAQKKPSAFTARLKSIFQEKELPPGDVELELSAKSSSDELLGGDEGSKLQNADLKLGLKQDQKAQTLPKPIFTLKEKPPAATQTAQSSPSALKVPPPVPPKPKIVLPEIKDLPSLKPLKLTNPAPEAAPQKSPKSDLADTGQINNLQDLAGFRSKTLEATSLDNLVKKIKSLIDKYGYFEVIFNIEKSRLYNNYIGTGLKLLSGQSDFESLGEEDYLSKEQFEKFTDLLAQIQAS